MNILIYSVHTILSPLIALDSFIIFIMMKEHYKMFETRANIN